MKRVVIKIGGSVLEKLDAAFFLTCASLIEKGWYPMIVHGGGPVINQMQKRFGQSPNFEEGLRVTDDACMEVVEMVLCGRVNKMLVSQLQQAGTKAVGISGVDGSLLQASQKDPRLGWVGNVERVEPHLLETLLSEDWLPVIASLGADANGQHFNINADSAAAAIAGAMKAERLILVTDMPGVLDGQGGRVSELTPTRIAKMIEDGEIHGGMIPKVMAALSGLASAQEVFIVDGSNTRSVDEMITGAHGTRIRKEETGDGAISYLSKK
ncbi:acetylglutamate kinase [Marininema halotolerans]|uniref:Acetylglutamate kinase n=1 Tax=Marininema halotolerans TaxID=1155944 RepID=A0A1I6NZ40_9BACL|nr:acetylglutamate kinase [Marininema halotolerans]SFS33222.1 acetylglutamate kinase [Marininema halotolerans]